MRVSTAGGRVEVSLRRLPFAYRSMLRSAAISIETPDRRVYSEIMRFLNTTETRAWAGRRLRWAYHYFDMPPDQLLLNTDDAGRAMVRDLIRSGQSTVFILTETSRRRGNTRGGLR